MSVIQKLQVENVKRIKAVTIEPDGSLVIIGGKNGAGKTSVLDAIAYAIGGQKLVPSKPLREGAKRGSVSVTIGDLKVVRTFAKDPGSGNVTSTIKVTSSDETKTSPQALLDKLVGDLSFDPLEFSRMKGEEQLSTLRNIVGLDLSELEDEIREVFEQRKDIKRDFNAAKAGLSELPHFADAPKESVSVVSLLRKIDEIRTENEDLREKKQVLSNIIATETTVAGSVDRLEEEVKEAEARLKTIERKKEELVKAIEKTEGGIKEQDVSPYEKQITAADETNRQIQANEAYEVAEKRAANLERELLKKETILDEKREQRKSQISGAEFPVEGLSFGDGIVLFNDLPFDQASGAEQLRVSVAMGLAANPELRVLLVRDGSLLDEENLALVADMAEKAEAQIWIERVGEGEEVSVVIEDGTVKEVDSGSE